MLTVLAPAKLNLTLEVRAKRQDGFHEIRSVIQTITLSDRLRFESGKKLEFKSDSPDWMAEKSLLSRAASLLQQVTGCSQGATIEIKKCIPLMSGLGGDSSDAAAVLCGLNRLWNLELPGEELRQLAQQLGSDVAFFLYGGTALVEGRGEIVTPLPPLPHRWVILTIPPIPRLPGKTSRLYNSLKSIHYTDGQITQQLVKTLKVGEEFSPSLLFNTFENVASTCFIGLDVYREHLVKIGVTNVHLAGSGPTLFTLIKDQAEAEALYLRLQQQKMEAYLVETLATVD